MVETIYIILTSEGFTAMKATIIEKKVTLWVNKRVLTNQQLEALKQSNTTIHLLPDHIDADNEKSVLTALKYVEQQSQQAEIFVEYI